MGREVYVCAAAAIGEGDMCAIVVGGQRIVVAHIAGHILAVDGECTHECAYLEEGELDDDLTVTCPVHFARFSLVDGEVLEGPAEEPLSVYPVQVRDGDVYVMVP